MRPPIPPRSYQPKGEDDVRALITPGKKTSVPRSSVWADGSEALDPAVELFTAAQVAERMNASISANAIDAARRRQELAAVRVGRRYLYRLEDVEAWIAAHASMAKAVTEVVLNAMRDEATQKARLIALTGSSPDEQPSMASVRVGQELMMRGFTRGARHGSSYRRGPLRIELGGGLHGKNAACEISINGKWNVIDHVDVRGREQTVLVVVDALLAHLSERGEADGPYIVVAPQKGRRRKRPTAEDTSAAPGP